jgi:pimeloyl-ACP methyl ester carboxylesterase
MVAQQLTLDRPDLVRRLVIAGSGPGFLFQYANAFGREVVEFLRE